MELHAAARYRGGTCFDRHFRFGSAFARAAIKRDGAGASRGKLQPGITSCVTAGPCDPLRRDPVGPVDRREGVGKNLSPLH